MAARVWLGSALSSPEGPWAQIRQLALGDHLHLDEVLDSPPPPGSRNWSDLIRELVRTLAQGGGEWTVVMTIGTVSQVPTVLPNGDDLFDLVSSEPVVEPPAVYRLNDTIMPRHWEGECHSYIRVAAGGVTEIARIDRSAAAAARNEAFRVALVFEIRHDQASQ